MKNILILVLVFAVSCVCIGCSKDEPSEDSVPISTEFDSIDVNEEPNNEEPEMEEEIAVSPYEENPTIFDFSVLPEDDFPRGEWTINELIKKYGNPEEMIGTKQWNGGVHVRIHFATLSVYFVRKPVEYFSFHEHADESGDYELDESDKDIPLYIVALQMFDPSVQFPNGIKIGLTTKSQVVAAYQEESASQNKMDWIDLLVYKYTFYDEKGVLPTDIDERDVGEITFIFDENEVLSKVAIGWFYYDSY